MTELQLSFDALGFGPDFLAHVPVVRAPKKRGEQGPRTCSADPYGLLAMRAERQLGLRRSYSLADFISAARDIGVNPSDKDMRCFAYCLITAHAVASRYFLRPEEVFTNTRNTLEPAGVRHICQHIAVENGSFSTMAVGRAFNRSHASVRHSVNSVAAKRLASPALEAELDNLEHVIIDLWALAGNGEGLKDRLAVIV
ncbi:hypothetical protein [Cohaesibacter celericrescens]|nr:hypothetical protein [Cohaesibacter celericrescens]